MPPLALLARPQWSSSCKIAMLTLGGYLLVSVILLLVKAIQLGGGAAATGTRCGAARNDLPAGRRRGHARGEHPPPPASTDVEGTNRDGTDPDGTTDALARQSMSQPRADSATRGI